MLHICIRRFDVTGTVDIFLETNQSLNKEETRADMENPRRNRDRIENTHTLRGRQILQVFSFCFLPERFPLLGRVWERE